MTLAFRRKLAMETQAARVAQHEQSPKKFGEFVDTLMKDNSAKKSTRGRNQSRLEERIPLEAGWFGTENQGKLIAAEIAKIEEAERLKQMARQHASSLE